MNPFVPQKLVLLMSTERGSIFDKLRALIEAGAVKPLVDRTFPLSDALNVIDHVHSRQSIGKVVVTI